jgi:hypothetical protein
MSTEKEEPILDVRTLNYIESILADIRGQIHDYASRILTIDMGSAQGIRDHLATFSAQLADMYGDIVTEHDLAKAKYNVALRERQRELWLTYQMDNEEINPEGKMSKTGAQDKARYQAVIDVYPIARKIAKLKGLEERANALWRYTIPKLLDSIASRIALAREYPEGLPTHAMPISKRHKSNFDILFGDTQDDLDRTDKAMDDVREEFGIVDPNEIPDTSPFYDENL